jgi:hypothetical protein
VAKGSRFLISNWWIGSTCMVSFAVSLAAAILRRGAGLFPPGPPGAVIKRGARDEPRGAHYIEHARGKAEQEEYHKPPGRAAEPAIDEPAETGTDHNACDKFAGEPEAPGVTGCSRRPIRTRTVGRPAGMIACMAKAFVKPLESRGESGFIGRLLVPIAVFARVAHALDTRGPRPRHAPRLKSRADHTDWVPPSQETADLF